MIAYVRSQIKETKLSITLEPRVINGITYYPEVGIIDQVLNDVESHNIPAWNIYFKFGNVGQGTGNRRSNTPTGRSDINAILWAMNVSSLEELVGMSAIALHRGNASGQIAGIANAHYPDAVAIFHH